MSDFTDLYFQEVFGRESEGIGGQHALRVSGVFFCFRREVLRGGGEVQVSSTPLVRRFVRWDERAPNEHCCPE